MRTILALRLTLLFGVLCAAACDNDDIISDEQIEEYTSKLVKSCSVSELWPSAMDDDIDTDSYFVDMSQLFLMTGGRLTYQLEDGSLYYFGAPTGGEGFYQVSERTVDSADTGQVSARSELSDNRCRMWIDDELVFDAIFYRTVPVEGVLSPSDTRDQPSVPFQFGYDDYDGTGIFTHDLEAWLASAGWTRSEEELEVWSDLVETSTVQANINFPFEPRYPRVARFEEREGIEWFLVDNYTSQGLGETQALEALTRAETLSIRLVQLGASFVHPDYQTEPRAVRPLTLDITISDVESDEDVAPDSQAFTLSMVLDGWTRLDDEVYPSGVAADCLDRRIELAEDVRTSLGLNELLVQGDITAPCGGLTPDLPRALLDNDTSLQIAINHATRFGPNIPLRQYSGWETLLIELVIAHSEDRSESPSQLFESIAQTPALQADLDLVHNASLESLGANTQALYYELPVRWWYIGADDTTSTIERLLASGRTLLSAFEGTLIRLLRDFLDGGDGLAFLQLQCADGLTDTPQNRWLEVFEALSGYEAAAEWLESYERDLLLKCVTDDAELAPLVVSAEATAGFIDEELDRLGGELGLTAKSDISAIITRALDEQWDTDTYAELGAFALLIQDSGLFGLCDEEIAHSEAILCAEPFSLSPLSTQPEHFLDPTFNGRYTDLAAVTAELGREELLTSISLAIILGTDYFERDVPVVWSACDDASFADNLAEYERIIRALGDDPSINETVELQNELEDLAEICL